MKKLLFLLIFSFLFVGASISGDRFVKEEHVTFAGLEVFSDVIKKTVACVQIKGDHEDDKRNNDWVPKGTAFLINVDNVVYAITCNHVVSKFVDKKVPVYIAIETDKIFQRAPCEVIYQDAKYDIAVLKPTKDSKDTYKLKNLLFKLNDFAESALLKEGKGVIIPGYPLGLGATIDENHPVVRFGIIAQNTGGPFFLVDGVASHGNSGSPVFSPNDKKIVGMITSHMTDFIKLMDENQRVVASLPYNSGLGRVVSSKVLKDTIEKAVAK